MLVLLQGCCLQFWYSANVCMILLMFDVSTLSSPFLGGNTLTVASYISHNVQPLDPGKQCPFQCSQPNPSPGKGPGTKQKRVAYQFLFQFHTWTGSFIYLVYESRRYTPSKKKKVWIGCQESSFTIFPAAMILGHGP